MNKSYLFFRKPKTKTPTYIFTLRTNSYLAPKGTIFYRTHIKVKAINKNIQIAKKDLALVAAAADAKNERQNILA